MKLTSVKTPGIMRINEIFYSLQGEGFFAGTAAVFVRFSGCNESCDFCDTDHRSYTNMTEEEILDAVRIFPARHIVLTGGEPSLQLTASLIDALHADGWFVQVETNGSRSLPKGIDWVTCSPKSLPLQIGRVDELKVVYQGDDALPESFKEFVAKRFSLQPCDYGDPQKNLAVTSAAVDYVKRHPHWHLSLQLHKLLNIR